MNLSQLHPIEAEILQFLFAYKNEYLSSQRIAENSGVSSKTVRKYINSLNDFLKAYEAEVEMKKGTGYQLIIHDNNRFYPLLDAIREQATTIEESYQIKDSSDRERFILNLALASGVNFETGELDIPFVEISNSVKGQFKYLRGSNTCLSYSDFLAVVDAHFETTVYEEEDNEYEIKLHTHVEPQTLMSKKHQKIKVTKNDEKQIYHPAQGFMNAPHTPPAKELHYQISRVMNDDLKMHRAKSDYEFTQRVINNQQQRQQGFEMDY